MYDILGVQTIIADSPVRMRGVDRYHIDEYDINKLNEIEKWELIHFYFLLKHYEIQWNEDLFKIYMEVGEKRNYKLVNKGLLLNDKYLITENTEIWDGRLTQEKPVKINLEKIREDYKAHREDYMLTKRTLNGFEKYFSVTVEQYYFGTSIASAENFVIPAHLGSLDNEKKLFDLFEQVFESRNDNTFSLNPTIANRDFPFMFEEKEYYIRMAQLQKCIKEIQKRIEYAEAFRRINKEYGVFDIIWVSSPKSRPPYTDPNANLYY